jgi:hypothetical protein
MHCEPCETRDSFPVYLRTGWTQGRILTPLCGGAVVFGMRVRWRRLLIAASAAAGLLMSSTVDASAITGDMLYNVGSGHCLGIQGSSTASGAYAEVGICSGTPTQTWTVRQHIVGSDGVVADQFLNGANLCLGVLGNSLSAGVQAVQLTCSGTNDHSQFWSIIAEGGGYELLKNFHSGKCLGVKGNSASSGAYVQQQDCNSRNTFQFWQD